MVLGLRQIRGSPAARLALSYTNASRGFITPGVSCAAGRRLKGGGRGREAAARQCACGCPLRRDESGSPGTDEGCGLSGRQQAEAFCRVNRAQPTHAPAVSAAQRGWTALLKTRINLLDKTPLII